MAEKGFVLALGAFDGLHKAHIKVIKTAVSMAKKRGALAGVVTFKDNPTLHLKGNTEYIITEKEKDKILYDNGVDEIFKLDFTSVKDLSAETFFKDILINKLKAVALVCGHNFSFGKNAEADVEKLQSLCDNSNIELNTVQPVTDRGETVSSTLIRKYIAEGNMKRVSQLLNRNFSYSFEVVRGNKIGRTLGTPTINQQFPKGFAIPKYGVYAALVTVDGKKYAGVTNVGVKPSIGKYDPLSETWIADIDMNLYGMEIEVELLDFIREEKKFKDLEELKTEIYKNAEKAKEICKAYL